MTRTAARVPVHHGVVVDALHPLEVVVAEVGQRACQAVADVVVHDVEPAVAIDGAGNQAVDVR
jgi:hypothetical protein